MAGLVACVLVGHGVGGHHLLPATVPNGIFLEGMILGALNGLLAVGLVLIYRTNRIINFAQGELGAFAATLAEELHVRFRWPFLPAVAVAIAAAVVTSGIIEFGVIRRFARAPRLILTVATLGVAQILGFIELAIPNALNSGPNRVIHTFLTTPLSFRWEFGKVIFRGDHLFVIIATPLIIGGLVWFFRSTGYGLAARATAENSDRARLLGVRVKRVSLVVWMIAGALSAVTAILEAPVRGFQFGGLGGFTLLTRALAAAVIGRMENLPVTFGAAILITTAQQTLFFGTSRAGPTDGFTLLSRISTAGAYILFLSVVCLLINFYLSWRRPVRVGANPWDGHTLEWAADSPPAHHNFERLPLIRSERPVWDMNHGEPAAPGIEGPTGVTV